MIEFNVPAMSCAHCERAVSDAVKGVDPAAKVEVDLASKRVRIDSNGSRATLAAALAEEGYPPVD